MVDKWFNVAKESELKQAIHVDVDNKKIALFKLDDGSIHAIDGICTHEYALLADGDIDGDQVICPEHGSKFNVRTGAVDGFPATEPVNIYPVKIENGNVFVNISPP
jgi:nitrite reductase/ring-hydroxylating ferredoxin subunit